MQARASSGSRGGAMCWAAELRKCSLTPVAQVSQTDRGVIILILHQVEGRF